MVLSGRTAKKQNCRGLLINFVGYFLPPLCRIPKANEMNICDTLRPCLRSSRKSELRNFRIGMVVYLTDLYRPVCIALASEQSIDDNRPGWILLPRGSLCDHCHLFHVSSENRRTAYVVVLHAHTIYFKSVFLGVHKREMFLNIGTFAKGRVFAMV